MPKIKRGQKAVWVGEETDYTILKALKNAMYSEPKGLRFTGLLGITKRSRDTLSVHLPRLLVKKHIGYDRLTKRYFITDEGLKALEDYERQNFLQSVKNIYRFRKPVLTEAEVKKFLVPTMFILTLKALEDSLQKVSVQKAFEEAFSLNIYSDLLINMDQKLEKSVVNQASKLVLRLLPKVASFGKGEVKSDLEKMERAKLLLICEFDFKKYLEAQESWLRRTKGFEKAGEHS